MKIIQESMENENYKKIDRVTLDILCDTLKSHLLKIHFEEYLKKCETDYKIVSLPSTVVLFKKRNLSKTHIVNRMFPLSAIDTNRIIAKYSFYIDKKTLNLHMCKKDVEIKGMNCLEFECKEIKPQHHKSYCKFVFFYFKVSEEHFIDPDYLPINEESYEKLKEHYFKEVKKILSEREKTLKKQKIINIVPTKV
jgi:hypothetical protein